MGNEADIGGSVRAGYRPQETCPKPWVAIVDGETVFEERGGFKRFASQMSAFKAALAAAHAKDSEA